MGEKPETNKSVPQRMTDLKIARLPDTSIDSSITNTYPVIVVDKERDYNTADVGAILCASGRP